ncbi:MAG: hypothetical protein LBE08_10415, partial [Bifidobacteriaceae bacterium]|nr:hypothetical protein [Bifidobacteriaceae bacterium]
MSIRTESDHNAVWPFGDPRGVAVGDLVTVKAQEGSSDLRAHKFGPVAPRRAARRLPALIGAKQRDEAWSFEVPND